MWLPLLKSTSKTGTGRRIKRQQPYTIPSHSAVATTQTLTPYQIHAITNFQEKKNCNHCNCSQAAQQSSTGSKKKKTTKNKKKLGNINIKKTPQ